MRAWVALPGLPAWLLLGTLACATGGYPDLRDCHDPVFQSQVDAALEKFPRFWQGVRDRELSFVAADVTDLRKPAVAWYNPELMLYAASLPKVGIIFAAAVEIQEGNLELDDELREHMVKAVQVSSNPSATWLLDKVGIERAAEILQDPAHGALYDPAYGGGLWVGRAYAKRPAWRRDPIHGITHGASAMSVARFYYGAMTGSLVDREYGPLLGEVFGNPKLKHKFVKGLKGREGVDIYRKSGSWQQFHADSGVIVRPDGRYIVVAIDAKSPDSGDGFVRGIQMIDDVMLERTRGNGDAR